MNKKRSKKKKSTLRVITSVVIFALIAGVIVLVAVNARNLSLAAMGRTLKSWFGIAAKTEGFYYEDQESVAFAELSGGLVAASDTGFVVFDRRGDKIADRNVLLSQPTVVSNNGTAGVYDSGGSTLFIIDNKGAENVYESDKNITSVSVNRNGWFALCTEESNYMGSVTVLNSDGDAVYKLYSGDGYVLSAVISDDNSKMFAVKLNTAGTEIVEYRLDSEEVQSTVSIPLEVALMGKYGAYGDTVILTDASFQVFGSGGKQENVFEFTDYSISDFSLGGDGFSVVSCTYQSDAREYLITLDDYGKVLAKQEVVKEVMDVSATGQFVAVLYSDGLTVYDKSLRELETYEVSPGVNTVIMCSDGSAIASGAYSAEVLG